MKNAILLTTLFLILCSFSSDIIVDPSYLGTWRAIDKHDGKVFEVIFMLQANKKSNKIDIYKPVSPEGHPYITVKMQDATHFKGTRTINISIDEEENHSMNGYFDGSELHTFDHVELKNYTTKTIKHGEWNYVFRRWDKSTQKYIDSLSHH